MRGIAINDHRPASADVALTVASATVLGVTVGVLLAEMVVGVVVGGGYRSGVPLRAALDHRPEMIDCADQAVRNSSYYSGCRR
ncbi:MULTISPECIES: hypothetical protein [Rhodococcus erythropolis group]|uniref:hypothetical protein n=1 Tax=Rhodococcus erythropolis group TaxID=2840174 RepID=UPI0001A21A9C|nr:hypothetical protein RHOER0001_4591 [Rhodococcus erythropolis SK121]MDN5543784.1 hypothetical protein [Rhodococcus sp. (in: high G+C Gram-positive bacteria)]